ncbi:DUF1129 family protein [Macrococcoides goetzii]|uniref:DUF1129 family protein n=1 Tax=Macrococcoides goetzii TaxID=1891097 RepID=A0A395GA66_9STAP|nr:DUF1129 family protein [Macrococcus goetzii]RAI80543.1 DUF1129 family protein [Macrococcus goetzii]
MKTKDIIEQNNLKREELTPENLKVYEQVLMYLRCDLSISERVTEVTLMDLLDHLLEAQMHDVTTEEFFGHDPEQFAKDLVAEIPKESKRNMWMFGASMLFLLFAIFRGISGIADFIIVNLLHRDNAIYLGSELSANLITSLVIGAIIFGIFKYLQLSAFKEDETRGQKIIIFFVLWIVMVIPFLVSMFLPDLIHIGPVVHIPWYVNISIGIAFYLLYKLLFNASRNDKEVAFIR